MARRLTSAAACFLLLEAAAARGQDEVPVPGGPAAIRRLLSLEANRPKAAFFLDLHELLVSNANPDASWSHIEGRKALVSFVEDLNEWRSEFGKPAVFSMASREGWKRVKRALEWHGFKVRGEDRSFTTEPRGDAQSVRRQTFLDTLGMPLTLFLSKLRAGENVTVTSSDDTAPLPFGLGAWRETLDERDLSAPQAFLYFVKNVRASRMLVALHALDAETREELRTLIRDEKGRALGWRILYDKVLDAFTRFPEALALRDHHFLLPGGKEAEPIWTDILGISPSDRAAFLPALFETDSGKAAYVVDILQQLPKQTARDLLLGRTGGGPKAVKRFRRLYRSIDRGGESHELMRRDPYDFGHLARFLRLSDEGDLALPAADLDGGDFPRSEADLAEILSRANQRSAAPEETLRKLFRREATGAAVRFPAQRRFLIISSLLEGRPGLQDPGVAVLLFRGVDRFLPAYAVLEDLPLDGPKLARKYLFTLGRLDRRGASRDSEVAAGLFEGGVELLAQLSRAGALDAKESQDLFSAFLDLPLFSREDLTPARGERDLFVWLSARLLPTLKAAERRLIEARRREEGEREEAYRVALRSRDARIEARRAAERAKEEEQRAAAERKLRWFLDPVCLADDQFVGPLRPRFLEEEEQLGMNEALEIEMWRARPLAPEARRVRIAGAIAESSTIQDSREPLPEFIPVDVLEEADSSDELLTRALAGPPATAHFEWRGGHYRFDAATDDANRRRQFRQTQRLTWLADLEAIHRKRDALLAAAAKSDLAAAKSAARDLVSELKLPPANTAKEKGDEDERIRKEYERARESAAELARISKPKRLSEVTEPLLALDAVLAERHLESLLGHVYAASAGDPNDLYYQDPGFVRRHSFRAVGAGGKLVELSFAKTALADSKAGGGSRVSGSLFGLADVLGQLHAEQLPRKPGAHVATEDITSGLVAPVRRMSAARLDDDALRFVAASCRATEELASALGKTAARERSQVWSDLAKDLVPRSRLGLVSALEGEAVVETLSQYLSPSDLYRIGRRLALGESPTSVSAPPSAVVAREALGRLRKRLGESGARDRLAEFGPRATFYAGRFRLTDMDMPPYERLTAYRTPQVLSDRLYDLKIAVARRVEEAGLPAAVLPLLLAAGLDEMMAGLTMTFPFDWASTVRSAQAFGRADLERLLDDALKSGRITRDQSADELQGRQ